MAVSFSDVKQILDDAITGWKARTGRDPILSIHGGNFGWDSRDDLLLAEAFTHRLIDPSLIGNNKGHQTNLVIALRDQGGVSGLGQMPSLGPFLEPDKIDRIIEWINDGAPDDAECLARQSDHDISQTVELEMRDPDVNRQSDLAPYPDGPGKLLNKWEVTVGFNTTASSPIQIRVTGIPGGSGPVRPGNVFDGIQANDVFQDTGSTFEGSDTHGCMVLQNASVPPTQSPPYDPKADHFPDPNETYNFRHIAANGRWFLVQWQISVSDAETTLQLTARQQPRVDAIADRKCP